jgi:hypothetical protein
LTGNGERAHGKRAHPAYRRGHGEERERAIAEDAEVRQVLHDRNACALQRWAVEEGGGGRRGDIVSLMILQ